MELIPFPATIMENLVRNQSRMDRIDPVLSVEEEQNREIVTI